MWEDFKSWEEIEGKEIFLGKDESKVNMYNAVSNFVRSWQQISISPCIFYQLTKRGKHRNQLNLLKNKKNDPVCLGKAQFRLIPGPQLYVFL